VDGDGRDDIVLGAASADGPENTRLDGGETYVLFGDTLESETDLRTDVDGSVFIYAAAGQRLSVVAEVLDLDGDGRAELLLLAPGTLGAVPEPGTLYLVQVSRR
jgi:hypothetical protein